MFEELFFPGARRRYTLADYRQLKSKADEKRKKLLITSELGPDGSMVGIPEFIADPYSLLAKSEIGGRYDCDKKLKLEAMTIEVYSTDRTKKRSLLLTGCTFKRFVIEKDGMDDKATFTFTFIAYVPDSLALHDWCRNLFICDFFAKFDFSQGSLDLEKPKAAPAKEVTPQEEEYAESATVTLEDAQRIAALAPADIALGEAGDVDDEDDDEEDGISMEDEVEALRAVDEGLTARSYHLG